MTELEWLASLAMGSALIAHLLMMLIVTALVVWAFKQRRGCFGIRAG
ncbi:MAG: hypothetical protein VX210_08360 [Myxococcota bacterium]|nr:hypothetical protein [Myxococcota bacterium]